MLVVHPCYLEIHVGPDDNIEGDVREGSRAGRILVTRLEHRVSKPIDLNHMRPMGREEHHAFVITKAMDRASPRLAAALAACQVMSYFRFKYYTAGPKGGTFPLYVITLGDVVISSIETWAPETPAVRFGRRGCLETISLCYQSIRWAHYFNGTMSERTLPSDI